MKWAVALALVAACSEPMEPAEEVVPAPLRLEEWERGIAVRSLEREGMDMYLWFYEWNLFDAFEPGETSPGSWTERELSADGLRATLHSNVLHLEMRVDEEGVALEMTVTNLSDRAWPEVAAMIPCFNPGPAQVRNQEMAHHHATWFLGAHGLERVPGREIHLNGDLREAILARSDGGVFGFDKKWPPTDADAVAGLILRQSRDREWVSGIAWDRFLTVQAHNPWQCMHLSARVGPLAPGESRVLRGYIWHFAGDHEDLAAKYRARFGG